MNAQIHIQDLQYSVSGNKILRGMTLRAEQKQIVGLIGPNGSGKSTLLKSIYRAIPPEKNKVFIKGKAIEQYSCREVAQQVSVVSQEHAFDFEYSVLDMVLMGRLPHRKLYERDTAEDFALAQQALSSLGLADWDTRLFSSLSGGEKQRVLIARSLVQDADILLLDEPTNHLDVHYQWSLMEMIASLNRTVLSVFHELNLAFHFCDYLYVLKNGYLVAEGYPLEVCKSDLLAEVFGVRAEVVCRDGQRPQILIQGSV